MSENIPGRVYNQDNLSQIFVYWCINDDEVVEIFVENKSELIGALKMYLSFIDFSIIKIRSFSTWGFKDGQSLMKNKVTTFNVNNRIALMKLIKKLEGGK